MNYYFLINKTSVIHIKYIYIVAQPTVGRWVGLALQVCIAIPFKTDFGATGQNQQ